MSATGEQRCNRENNRISVIGHQEWNERKKGIEKSEKNNICYTKLVELKNRGTTSKTMEWSLFLSLDDIKLAS